VASRMSDSVSVVPRQDDAALTELLVRSSRGDRSAFEALYRSTSSRLFGICLSIVAERAEAEDVLQEVFALIWSKAAQFKAERANPMAWLSMIARNKAIDRRRTLPGRNAESIVELELKSEDPEPALLAQAASDRARLDRCLSQLDARRRWLIRAAFFDGSTYASLAARVGAPLGSIKSLIRRSLLQLRACLEP
jgi:RNA polymerase sigma-70 factor, ECF subfamily